MSRQRFQDKIAVVTGGNSGIGLAAAKAYALEGAKVVITGRDEKTLSVAAKEIGPDTLAIQADAGNVSAIEKAVAQIKARFGKIDALFVNAGIAKFIPIEEVTEQFFDETLSVNLKGVFFTIQKALPLMPKGSAIVLNGSVSAHLGMTNTTVYAASKAAVISLAKTLSAELIDREIRVNVISPGPITTQIMRRMGMSPDKEKEMLDWIQTQVPMKRFGRPEEIAAAVLHLTSSESSFTIGTELIIDGGIATL